MDRSAQAAPRRLPSGIAAIGWPARILLVCALLLPSLLLGWVAWNQRTHVLVEAAATAQRTVAALNEHAEKVFETHALVLRQVDRETAGLDWDGIAESQRLHRLLIELERSFDQIASITLADADGRVRATSNPAMVGATNIADREYFTAQKERDAGIFVGKTFLGRSTGERRFALSMRRTSDDGGFDGIIAVAVDIGYFTNFWKDFAPTVAHIIPLVREDGELLVRYPTLNNPERINPNGPFLSRARATPRGVYTAVSAVDGVERLNAYSRIRGYPLYVSFSIETRAALRPWLESLTLYGVFSLIATAALLALSLMVVRQYGRERRSAERWQDTAAHLEQEIERRQQAEATLLQAQKMEVVGQLTGGVAHDFNNILQALGNNLYLIGQHTAGSPAHRFVTGAEQSVERAAKLTQQLMAFARKQRLEPRPVELRTLVLGMGELLQRTLGGTVEVDIDIAPDVWPAMVDPNQTEMAILNLAINARDAMPAGGRLTIGATNVSALGSPAAGDPADFGRGDYVRLSVADTGTGMPDDVLERVFEPFFTTKEVGKGSGLGLSMVHGFAAQSGGTVHVESRVGQGTVVKIYLPRAEAAAAPAIRTATGAAPSGEGTILLVDDEALVRQSTAMAMEEAGYRVLQARNGAEALEMLRGEPVDVLVTDYAMPGMKGTELAQLARSLRPEVGVLMITGYAGQPDRETRSWPETVLHKPFRTAELVEAVEALRERRRTGSNIVSLKR